MRDRTHWVCPFCGVGAMLISGDDSNSSAHSLRVDASKHGERMLVVRRAGCPNPSCREFELSVSIHPAIPNPRAQATSPGPTIRTWRLIPESAAKILPDYVPQAIRDDYLESCRIVSGSPKASATLARRCLQGMIRDFWGIKKGNLAEAIKALRSRVGSDEFEAIDSVRKVGNIGAHMEKKVDHIIEVDPGEAEKLIRLIELLIEDWYVRKHQRELLLAEVRQIADDKKALRKPGKPALPVAPEVEADSPATTEEGATVVPSAAQEQGAGTVES